MKYRIIKRMNKSGIIGYKFQYKKYLLSFWKSTSGTFNSVEAAKVAINCYEAYSRFKISVILLINK